MTQIICDICGKVVKCAYTKINLPSMYGGEVVQRHDEETAHDVCRPCAIDLCTMITKFIKQKRG